MMNRHKWLSFLGGCVLLAGVLSFGIQPSSSYAQAPRYFPETGKSVGGRFLEYWDQNGGLAQQGYPISDEFQETSDTDGKVYTVQYFQRAVFEKHPENARPFDVLLSLLGTFYYNQKYGGNAPGQKVSTDNPQHFTETGHTIGGAFRKYWESNGGLAQQGYPISDEFEEVDKDGVMRTVQYFQRAVFEFHQEFAGTQNEVLLSLLGVFYYQKKYGGSPPPSGPTPTATPVPGATQEKGDLLLFYKKDTGAASAGWLGSDGAYHKLREFTLPTGWVHLVAIGDNRLFCYNPGTGAFNILRIDEDGSPTLFQGGLLTNSTEREATSWVSPGGGVLFYYKFNSGMGYTAFVDGDGAIVGERALTGFHPHWTDIVASSNGILLFYDSSSGYAATGKVNADFTFTTLKDFPTYFAKNWLSLIPANDGYFIAYGNPGGAGRSLAVSRIDDAGNISQARPTIPFETGWSIIASTSTGRLLFYSINGKAETGIVDVDAEYATIQAFGPGSFGNGWTNIIGIK
jgi:hypothetical protein